MSSNVESVTKGNLHSRTMVASANLKRLRDQALAHRQKHQIVQSTTGLDQKQRVTNSKSGFKLVNNELNWIASTFQLKQRTNDTSNLVFNDCLLPVRDPAVTEFSPKSRALLGIGSDIDIRILWTVHTFKSTVLDATCVHEYCIIVTLYPRLKKFFILYCSDKEYWIL